VALLFPLAKPTATTLYWQMILPPGGHQLEIGSLANTSFAWSPRSSMRKWILAPESSGETS